MLETGSGTKPAVVDFRSAGWYEMRFYQFTDYIYITCNITAINNNKKLPWKCSKKGNNHCMVAIIQVNVC